METLGSTLKQHSAPLTSHDMRPIGALTTLKPVLAEDPGSLQLVPVGLAVAQAADVLVVTDDAGRPQHAICRRCPHLGADLAVYARPGDTTGSIKCRHARFQWRLSTGEYIGDPKVSRTTPIPVHDIAVDAEGEIWMAPARAAA